MLMKILMAGTTGTKALGIAYGELLWAGGK